MGLNHSPSIVLDGLVSYWDASNRRSYPGTGTDWSDISGLNYTLPIRNSPTLTTSNALSYFTLNGSTQDFYIASYTQTFTAITYNLWVWRNGTQSGYTALVMNRGDATGFTYHTSGTTLGYHWKDDVNTYTYSSGVDTPNQTWTMVTLTVSPTEARWYFNGVLQNTRTATHASTTFSNLYIGAEVISGRYYNGRISMVQIYNRALTATEILQNYDATKTRFGLS